MNFLLLLLSFTFAKQDPELMKKIDSVYQFKEVVNVERTEVKNQNHSGTCWTFAGNSFIESELIRMGKGKFNLSEMFIVRNMYKDKADNYVRYHGSAQFGEGALSHDVLNSIKKYGIIPESIYSARPENDYINHAEMSGILEDMVKRVVNTSGNNRTNHWKKAFDAVLDAYMGTPPTEFEYEGKKYTPLSFVKYLGINADDYVDITSFSHHPFYEEFVLEVPDNFSRGLFQNVKMQEMLAIVENALNNGYSVDWGSDVTEMGFNSDYGLAIDPKDLESMRLKKDEIKWDSLYQEIDITQEKRQGDFDNYLTEDDHGMHIVGIVKDIKDRKYFVVKNSWGTEKRGRDGYLYVSFPYFMHKTTSITVHKNAIPQDIKSKMKL